MKDEKLSRQKQLLEKVAEEFRLVRVIFWSTLGKSPEASHKIGVHYNRLATQDRLPDVRDIVQILLKLGEPEHGRQYTDWKKHARASEIRGEAKVLVEMLRVRCGAIPAELVQRLEDAGAESDLSRLAERVLTCSSVDEFLSFLDDER